MAVVARKKPQNFFTSHAPAADLGETEPKQPAVAVPLRPEGSYLCL
ncbi:MAG: hypothetical protein WA820_07330 [Bradyrhizobium sp.]|jgi:hypothetical protein